MNTLEWKTTDDYYKAFFTADGNALEAFFSFDGNLIAVSRKIQPEQLPMSLYKEVKGKASVTPITELFEVFVEIQMPGLTGYPVYSKQSSLVYIHCDHGI